MEYSLIEKEVRQALGPDDFNNLRRLAFEIACQEAPYAKASPSELTELVEMELKSLVRNVHEDLTIGKTLPAIPRMPDTDEISQKLREVYG